MKGAGAATSPESLKSSRPYPNWDAAKGWILSLELPQEPKALSRYELGRRPGQQPVPPLLQRARRRESTLRPAKARLCQGPLRPPGSSPAAPRLAPAPATLGPGLDQCPEFRQSFFQAGAGTT